MTNRVLKSISQYIASDDDLRPALNGIVSHGVHHIATDGHNLVFVESYEPFFEDTALYKFNSDVNLTSEFDGRFHEFINEKYPNVPGILPKDDTHHEVELSVDVLYRLIMLLRKLKATSIRFKFPENHHKAVTWEATNPVECERIIGLTMPMRWNEEYKIGDPFDEQVRATITEALEKTEEFQKTLNADELEVA